MNHPINLYTFTRLGSQSKLLEYENALEGRSAVIKSFYDYTALRSLADKLAASCTDINRLNGFYHSYNLPQLSNSFCLLRITDKIVLDIELKESFESNKSLAERLAGLANYLRPLNRCQISIAYSLSENKLYLLKCGHTLRISDINELNEILDEKDGLFYGNPDELFRAANYLVSPIITPEKFVKAEYLLTESQFRIKTEASGIISVGTHKFTAIAGISGSGKTLLLYDIALQTSAEKRCCIINCGKLNNARQYLVCKIKKLDIFSAESICEGLKISEYDCIFVDDAHLLTELELEKLLQQLNSSGTICFFAYILCHIPLQSKSETDIIKQIQALPQLRTLKLTQRIRTNAHLAEFTERLFRLSSSPHNNFGENIELLYANNDYEAEKILISRRISGYTFINIFSQSSFGSPYEKFGSFSLSEFACKEYDSVIMLLNSTFYYDYDGVLKSKADYPYIKLLFEGLSRVREKLCLLVVDNIPLFRRLLSIL